jgi:hypothetical protein
VRNGRYFVFQLAEVAMPRALFAEILRRIGPETQPREPGTTLSCRDDLLWGLKVSMIAPVEPVPGESLMQWPQKKSGQAIWPVVGKT